MLILHSTTFAGFVALGLSIFSVLLVETKAKTYELVDSSDCGYMKDIANDWPVKGTEPEGWFKREVAGEVCDEETYDGRQRKDTDPTGITDDLNERIIGGYQATKASFPSFLGLVIRKTLKSKGKINFLVCGATLIGRNLAVTATHCFWNSDIRKVKFLPTLSNKDVREYVDIEGETERPSAKIVCHQDLSRSRQKGRQQNDFAVVGLDRPFPKDITAACLSRDPLDYGRSNMHMVGLGDGTSPVSRPIARDLPIRGFDNRTCEPMKPYRRDSKIDRDYFCGYGQDYGKACHGDSGSGLYYLEPITKRLTLAGVLSAGQDLCIRYKHYKNYMIYSNVGHYVKSGIFDTLLKCVNGESHPDCICHTGFFEHKPMK